MKLDKRKNFKRGVVWGIINNIVNILLPFIVQTVFIRTLGIEYVGIKGLFTSLLSVLSLTELGVGSAIVYSMYKPIAEDDIKTISALLKLYRKIYHFIGGSVLLIGLVMMLFLPKLIKGDLPVDINIFFVFGMYLLDSVLTYWLWSYKSSLLNAYQRTDVLSNISTAVKIILSVLQILVLIKIGNFYAYLVLAPISTVISNILLKVTVDRMFPEIRCEGNVPPSIMADIRQKVAGIAISSICDKTRNSFDNVFLSAFLGLGTVGIYSNYFYIFTSLNLFMGVLLNSIRAGIGNDLVKKDVRDNYNSMLKVNMIFMAASGFVTICMACLYQNFMYIWAGEGYLFSNSVMLLFPIYFFIGRLGDVRSLYADGAGLFWENRLRYILEAVMNIVLNYVLVKYFGVAGVLIATIITLFVFGFVMSALILFKYYFVTGIKEYFFDQLCITFITVFIGVVTYYFCSLVGTAMGIKELIIRAMICAVVPSVLYLFVFIINKRYREILKWFLGKA